MSFDSFVMDLKQKYNKTIHYHLKNHHLHLIILKGFALKNKEVLYLPKLFSKSLSLLINLGRVAQLDRASAF